MITQQTRQLSFEDIKPKRLTKYMQILEIIGNKEMTAREIETEMNLRKYSKYFDMNHVRPRLTELEKMELENINHYPVIDLGVSYE